MTAATDHAPQDPSTGPDPGTAETPQQETPQAAAAEVPLLTQPADGVPDVVDTPEALLRTIEALAAGRGPVAVDAERAHGFRYSQRAYLLQLRRAGSGTHLIDPVAFGHTDDTGTFVASNAFGRLLHVHAERGPFIVEQRLVRGAKTRPKLAVRPDGGQESLH